MVLTDVMHYSDYMSHSVDGNGLYWLVVRGNNRIDDDTSDTTYPLVLLQAMVNPSDLDTYSNWTGDIRFNDIAQNRYAAIFTYSRVLPAMWFDCDVNTNGFVFTANNTGDRLLYIRPRPTGDYWSGKSPIFDRENPVAIRDTNNTLLLDSKSLGPGITNIQGLLDGITLESNSPGISTKEKLFTPPYNVTTPDNHYAYTWIDGTVVDFILPVGTYTLTSLTEYVKQLMITNKHCPLNALGEPITIFKFHTTQVSGVAATTTKAIPGKDTKKTWTVPAGATWTWPDKDKLPQFEVFGDNDLLGIGYGGYKWPDDQYLDAYSAYAPTYTNTNDIEVFIGGVYLGEGPATTLLDNTTLGPSVVNSSLTSVGALTKLDVLGAVNAKGGFLVDGKPLATGGPVSLAPITLDTVNNRVGVNQTTPTASLDVTGNAHVSGTVDALNLAAQNSLLVAGASTMMDTIEAKMDVNVERNLTVKGGVGVDGDMSVLGDTVLYNANVLGKVSAGTVEAMNWVGLPPANVAPITLDAEAFRVGINKANPQFSLDVTGNANVTNNIRSSSVSTGYVGVNNVVIRSGSALPEGNISADPGSLYMDYGGKLWIKQTGQQTATGWIDYSDRLPITLDKTNKRVGINQTTPSVALDVVGEAQTTGTMYCSRLQTNLTAGAVAIGTGAGWAGGVTVKQAAKAVAIGSSAGRDGQQSEAVAIGSGTGMDNQGANAVSIGRLAGSSNQGSMAVAVGFAAGQTNQHANSIVLNAGTVALNTEGTYRFYVKPIRPLNDPSLPRLSYNATTGEICYGDSTTTSLVPITLDKTNARVGINKTVPTTALDVGGSVTASGGVSAATLSLTGVANTTTSNVLYYDSTTKAVSYGAAPQGGPTVVKSPILFTTGFDVSSGTPIPVQARGIPELFVRQVGIKPTNPDKDEITIIDDNSGWLTVELHYRNPTTPTGGQDSNGYAITNLPGGYKIDTSYHPLCGYPALPSGVNYKFDQAVYDKCAIPAVGKLKGVSGATLFVTFLTDNTFLFATTDTTGLVQRYGWNVPDYRLSLSFRVKKV